YEVVRPSCQVLAQCTEIEVRQPSPIRRLVFKAHAEVQGKPAVDSPIILNIPVELFCQGIFGNSAIVPQTTHAPDRRGWKSEQEISTGIAGVIAAEIDG